MFRHGPAAGGRRSGSSVRFPVFAMVSPFRPSSFHFRRRRFARAAGPCFARIARGRARPLAPARFARLIAPARRNQGAGRTSPVGLMGVFFRAGAKRERKWLRGHRLLPPRSILTQIFWYQAELGIITKYFGTQSSLHAPAARRERKLRESRAGPRYRVRSGTVRVRRPAPPRRSRAGPGRRTSRRRRRRWARRTRRAPPPLRYWRSIAA